jgi:uncharacterized protein YcfJ
MSLKSYIWLGLGIGSVVGGLIGAWLDNGNVFGAWSIILGVLGSLGGIWAGYKLYES